MPHGIPAQQLYLFTDLRHILCSDLQWLGPDDAPVRLNPRGEPVDVHASTFMMPHGIRLVTEPAQKTEPRVMLPDEFPARIIHEGGMYRGWNIRRVPGSENPFRFEIRHRESDNALDWRETHACRIDSPGLGDIQGFTVFIDPKAPAAERYKAVFGAGASPDQLPAMFEEYTRVHRHHRIWRFGLDYVCVNYGMVSPDGLEWTLLPEHLFVNFSDTDVAVYYDEELDRYVMYNRLMLQQRRMIGRASSEDFRHWTPIDPLIGPTLDDPFTDDIYLNGFSRYPNEPAYYLMFPMFYHRWDQTSDVRLASSDDGIYWQRVPGTAIPHGGPGEFDEEYIGIIRDLVPFGKDRVAIHYHGSKFPHKYPRWPHVLDAIHTAWAWWPAGRLSAVRGEEEGRFFTFPLEVKGRALCLNARTSQSGEIRVGIVDAPGRSAADCVPIAGDGLRLPVHWHGDDNVGLPDGRPITLEFRLRSADLFGFEWV